MVPQQREVVLLGENRELRRTLEDKLAQLYSIVENLYSASIKAEAETLIKQYEYLEEILHAATDYGVKWGRY